VNRHVSPATVAAHRAAERHPRVANLKVRSVFEGALHLYRREPIRVSVSALILLTPGLLMGVGSGAWLDRINDDTLTERLLLAIVIAVIAAVIGTLGTVFYAGVLDELVGAVIRGREPPSMREVMHRLPIWRLILADLAVSFIVGFAASLLVLPGFVLLAMLSTVGPIVNIEGRRVFASIRRATSLTMPHLWLTLTTIGLPLAAEIGADHYFLHLRGVAGIVIELVVTVPLILTVGVITGLNEVVLAYALLARDPNSSVAEMVRTSLERAGGKTASP
jgi:hypothetical protein